MALATVNLTPRIGTEIKANATTLLGGDTVAAEIRALLEARGVVIVRDLNLTDEQQSKLADIRDRQARAAIPIQGDLRIASLDMHKLMRAEQPDARAIDAQIDRISSLRASLQKLHVAGMLEARSVLTPAQQKIMREHGVGPMGRGMHGGPGMRMRHM